MTSGWAFITILGLTVITEIVLTQGHLIHTWQDARLFAALAGGLWFWRQRGILGTIVCGTAVLLVLRLGLGWPV